MNNKFNESKLATKIGSVIAEIIAILGAILFFAAQIKIKEEGYYVNNDWLVMKTYGIVFVITGLIENLICVIKSNLTSIGQPSTSAKPKVNAPKKVQELDEDDLENMDLEDIEANILNASRK